MADARAFVRVSADGTRFEQGDGRPFYFCGANCYYLLTRAADPGLRHECVTVLDNAAAAGLTVLRTWAFADGCDQWNALQPSPGVFDERVFQALDWLLAAAAARGLRLLLVLTNYWRDYGGMRQYVAWACQQRGTQPPTAEGEAAEPFYTDPDCQTMFCRFLHTLVHRTNTLTGVQYRDDPTILGWGLANEPRCVGDTACCTVARWAHHTAVFLKGLDPKHMVTLDTEGFLGPSTPADCRHNPYNCAGSGCDFASDCGSPTVDFACCHLYPDLWLPPHTQDQERARFALSWLDCHVALARLLGKPLVLSEFGKRRRHSMACVGHRAGYYEQVLGRVLQHMREGGLAGSAFWLMAAPSYPDHDGFTVYFSGTAPAHYGSTAGTAGHSQPLLHRQLPPPHSAAAEHVAQTSNSSSSSSSSGGGSRTAVVIRRHAAAVAELNRVAAGATGSPCAAADANGGASAGARAGASGKASAGPHAESEAEAGATCNPLLAAGATGTTYTPTSASGYGASSTSTNGAGKFHHRHHHPSTTVGGGNCSSCCSFM